MSVSLILVCASILNFFNVMIDEIKIFLFRGGNSTGDERGILDFVVNIASNFLGGADDKQDNPVFIPNYCW